MKRASVHLPSDSGRGVAVDPPSPSARLHLDRNSIRPYAFMNEIREASERRGLEVTQGRELREKEPCRHGLFMPVPFNFYTRTTFDSAVNSSDRMMSLSDGDLRITGGEEGGSPAVITI